MDMQVRVSADEGINAQASELTYSWLYQQVQLRANQNSQPKSSRLQRCSFCKVGHER